MVRVCKFLSDGRRQIEAFHVAGEVFGFELGAEHILSAEAVSDCTLVAYRRRSIELMAQKNHAVTHHLFEVAMQSLAQAQSHSLLLGRRGAVEKVAGFLLTWATHSSDSRTVHLAMTDRILRTILALRSNPYPAASRNLNATR